MSTLSREQLSVRLDTFEQKAIRLDRYANQDSNSMPHLRLMEQERDAIKDVIMAHDAALREQVARLTEEKRVCSNWEDHERSRARILSDQVEDLQQQLAAVTAERDAAVAIARGLTEPAPITPDDIEWAKAKLEERETSP